MKRTVILVCIVMLGLSASAQIRQSRRQSQTAEASYLNPTEFIIGGITVEGPKYLDQNALISLSGLKVGDRIKVPGDNISSAIKKLWNHGLVGDIEILQEKIEGEKIFLIISLTERPRLSKFVFEGVGSAQESEISDKIELYRGKVLTDAMIKNAENTVKSHYVEKGFLNTAVSIQQVEDTLLSNHVQLLVRVDKKSKVKIRRIWVEGNENIGAGKLKGKMKDTNEKLRFSLLNQLAYAVFHPKQASLKKYEGENNKERLMSFLGSHVNMNFFKSSKYIAASYEDDKRNLISYYNTKGYRDAIVTYDSIFNSSESTIDLLVRVEEGNKYYFRDIAWTGNYVHPDDVLDQILGIKAGDIYDMELIQQKLQFNPQGADISGLYMDDGYMWFNIQPVEVGIDGDSIDIEMRIFEGAQATVNKIIIEGNDRTNDHVILREINTLPGQKFSRNNIIRDNQRLAQLGFFDPEQINIVPVPNPSDNTVDMKYTLVERPSDQIELSGGWGGFYGFVGTLGLTFNNFSVKNITDRSKWHPLPIGDGQKLSIRAQANGKQYQSYSFMFSEPWLGGKKPNSFTISLNRSVNRIINNGGFGQGGFGGGFGGGYGYNQQPVVPTSEEIDAAPSLKVNTISLGLGRRLKWPDNYFQISNSLQFSQYILDRYFYTGSLGFDTGKANSVTFNTTIARNSLDSPMFPKSGSSVQLSINLTPPYSLWSDLDYENVDPARKYKWVEYNKWMLDAKYYVSLIGKLVLESSAHFGMIKAYSDDLGVGPFERYRLGGDGLGGQNYILGTEVVGMRGYANGSITPPYSSDAIFSDGLSGGIVYNKFAMELRYPITTGNAATIYVLGFVEAGNNWNNYRDFNPFDLYRSAGLGARLFMPAFGLIGLNWGYGFDDVPGLPEANGMQFHFTIGQQLR